MKNLNRYLNNERKKIREIEGNREKLGYIWDYYKLWIITLVAAVFIIIYAVVKYNTAIKENWFYLTIANTRTEVGNESELWERFVDYGAYDIKEKNVMFNTNCYFDPNHIGSNKYYTYFVAYVQAGTLDGILMEREDIETVGKSGWLMDLANQEIAGDLAERYADRLVYAIPNDEAYSTEPVPVGIDLSDTMLMDDYHIYEESCVLGVGAYAGHMDAVEKFLEFVLEEKRDEYR